MTHLEKSLAFLGVANKSQILDLSEFTRKKTYCCFYSGEKFALIYIGKARFLLNDALFLETLFEKICLKNKLFFRQKYFFLESALCSKAKVLLIEKGFIINAFV